jgi:pSer/pThr/pTyr-binding forkhead associated (FHA) protein
VDNGDSAQENPSVTAGEIPHGSGVLVVTRGPNVGARYVLGEGVTQAGRHPDSDIFLDDITVSRRHAEFTQVDAGGSADASTGGTCWIADVGSLNGTYVNRERIDKVALSPEDEVQIGKFKLVYLVAGDE